LLKRIIVMLLASFSLLSFTVSAKKMEFPTVSLGDEFYTFKDNSQELSEIFGISKAELEVYCSENNIIFLGSNEDNTKQVKLLSYSDDFSSSIINLSNLSNDKITALTPEIVGVENAKGEIIKSGKQKFIKVEFLSEDTGGKYVLTQYFTILNKHNFVLSFVTSYDCDRKYIEKTFENYSSCEFFDYESENKSNTYIYFVIIAFVVFLALTIGILVTFIMPVVSRNAQKRFDKPLSK